MESKLIEEYELKDMEMILDQLSRKIEDINYIIIDLIIFYLENKRHRYSKVAEYINNYSINDEQVTSYILSNTEKILRYVNLNKDMIDEKINRIVLENSRYSSYKEFNSEKFIMNIEKLQDHISLEKQRITFSQNRENKIFSTMIDEINFSISRAKEGIDSKGKEIENNLSTSIVSILGIFAAIVMVFFGGLTTLGSIMNNLRSISKFRIIFISSLLGMILFNVIFLLLYTIGKILGKDIGACCWPPQIFYENQLQYNKAYEKYLNAPRYGIKKVFIRYPIFFCFNMLMLLIQSVTFIFWYLNQRYSIKNLIIFSGCMVTIILFYFAIKLTKWCVKMRSKDKCNECNNQLNLGVNTDEYYDGPVG